MRMRKEFDPFLGHLLRMQALGLPRTTVCLLRCSDEYADEGHQYTYPIARG